MITNQKFEAFLRVQMSGVTNMFDITKVSELSGLDKKDVMEIMKNYGKYKYKFEDERDQNEKNR